MPNYFNIKIEKGFKQFKVENPLPEYEVEIKK